MTNRRGAAKDLRAARKRARRARIERDRLVTAKHGDAAHRSCGRKARYESRDVAEECARRYVALGAPPLRSYSCRYCGGWHLTKTKVRTSTATTEKRGGAMDGSAAMEEQGRTGIPASIRRAAAIDARLGMDERDIAGALGIAEQAVADAIKEFGDMSDGELGIATTGAGGADATPGEADHNLIAVPPDECEARLAGRFWLTVSAAGTPLNVFDSEEGARRVARALDRCLGRIGEGGVTVTPVEAWEEA